MNLSDAVESAKQLAAYKNEDHVVGRDSRNPGNWLIAHGEDDKGQQFMIDPKMVVHADGLDKKYIKEGIVRMKLAFPYESPFT